MAKKTQAAAATPAATATTTSSAAALEKPTPAPPTPAKKTTSSSSSSSSNSQQRWDQVAVNIVNHYVKTTPQRTKLLDVFMAFLVVVGGLQFLYCVVAGNYPFNAFLSGFAATVGQFVLTASLRIQTTEANKSEFPSISPERAFADFIVGSVILHFFCVNFIN